MGLAIVLAFVAGLITAVSPCVLPVLPIVLAGGVAGGENRRRPFLIIAGLAVSFFVSALFATWILDKLGLPKDLLRNISIGLLFLIAAILLVPQVGTWIERPLSRLSRRPSGDLGGGFVLGCALGFVFVPCAGPALAYVTSSAASGQFGLKAILITVAYTIGFSIVLLAIALGGRRVSTKLRVGVERFRVAFGVLIAAVAFALIFNLDTKLANIPWATDFFQRHTEASGAGLKAFKRGTNVTERKPAAAVVSGLPDYGPAPDFAGISAWFNSKPLTLAQLRGKVVLIDFWTYSCINCLRTLPHLEAWDRMYRDKGLMIVGVHTPEFAFESVPSNVRAAIKRLGIRYPVALDPKYGTWNHWGNQYWPAEYLIDKQGHVRHAHFGEGDYAGNEKNIRTLLGEKRASPASDRLADITPTGSISPETYLGYSRIDRYTGKKLITDKEATYAFPPGLGQNDLAYAGRWKVEAERIVAGQGARLRFHYHARKVYIVLGGKGRVQALVDGKPVTSFPVTSDKLYTVVDKNAIDDATLELRFTPGVEAYSFTFG
jgi:cytochrome c biogenesis protein CcdA/thiol-disulfide isomerase/thioredoxin